MSRIDVLDGQGWIELTDHMGDELKIVNAARIAYNRQSETLDDNDAMTVDVEMKDMYIDDYGKLQALTREITRQLRDEILITPRVRLVPKNTLPKSEGKAVRVVDTRKKY